MEYKRRQNRRWFKKTLISLIFGLFMTAKAEAGLLAPTLSVSPSSTNVPNGDTVTINIQSSVTVGVLSSISCQFSGGAFPTNASFTANGGSLLDLGGSVEATLTITNISAASAGTYTFSSSTVGLLGGLLTTTAPCTVGLTPTVTAVTTQTRMVSNGFKLQFSGPTGSNIVIQATSDMKNWSSLSTNIVVNGTVTYTDTVAKTVSCRFYRAKIK